MNNNGIQRHEEEGILVAAKKHPVIASLIGISILYGPQIIDSLTGLAHHALDRLDELDWRNGRAKMK